MSDVTPRLALPLIASGQAQKELSHNEALALIDAALQPAALDIGVDVPPEAPAIGACWIIGADPVGAWAGHPAALASWTDDGWRFVAPLDGMAVWLAGERLEARYASGSWDVGLVRASRLEVGGMQVVGGQQAAISAPVDGTTVDMQARAAISGILGALAAHGLIAS